jgi:hypothetical protein
MDGLFDIKHGISIRGKDYGFIGITDSEIDLRVDEMLLFVDSFKGSAGGTFGEEMEACVDFPYETLTLEKFVEFEKQFRKKYPTFDGHLYLHDINHFTADESKILDSMDYENIQDDDEELEEGDEWKHQ